MHGGATCKSLSIIISYPYLCANCGTPNLLILSTINSPRTHPLLYSIIHCITEMNTSDNPGDRRFAGCCTEGSKCPSIFDHGGDPTVGLRDLADLAVDISFGTVCKFIADTFRQILHEVTDLIIYVVIADLAGWQVSGTRRGSTLPHRLPASTGF